jgi:ATP-dependent 26S proteasome regulatory subunit
LGHFVVKSIKNLDEVQLGDVIEESDFSTLTERGNFVQLEYIEGEDVVEGEDAKPGIFSMIKTMSGIKLEKTQFTEDDVLKDFVNTKEVTDKIDKFINAVPKYVKYGIFPKRGVLLHGPAGSGKTTIIAESARKYSATGNTFILIWHTDKIEAGDVKDFIKHLNYHEDIEHMILIAEDIGGIEIDQARIRSESALLSLLDNQERTFKVPTLILATTNYPENFMGNLTNRPNRFDDKIRVGFPKPEQRATLLKFYDKENLADDEAFNLISSKKCEEFTPAHLREAIIRSAIYDVSVASVIKDMIKEIQDFKRAFEVKSKSGVGLRSDDDYDY